MCGSSRNIHAKPSSRSKTPYNLSASRASRICCGPVLGEATAQQILASSRKKQRLGKAPALSTGDSRQRASLLVLRSQAPLRPQSHCDFDLVMMELAARPPPAPCNASRQSCSWTDSHDLDLENKDPRCQNKWYRMDDSSWGNIGRTPRAAAKHGRCHLN